MHQRSNNEFDPYQPQKILAGAAIGAVYTSIVYTYFKLGLLPEVSRENWNLVFKFESGPLQAHGAVRAAYLGGLAGGGILGFDAPDRLGNMRRNTQNKFRNLRRKVDSAKTVEVLDNEDF